MEAEASKEPPLLCLWLQDKGTAFVFCPQGPTNMRSIKRSDLMRASVSFWPLPVDLKVNESLAWIDISIPLQLLGASHHGWRRRWAAGRGRQPCTLSANRNEHRQVKSSKCINIDVSRHGLLVGRFGWVKVAFLSANQDCLYEAGPAWGFSLMLTFPVYLIPFQVQK